MTTRTIGFAPLRATLLAAFLSLTISVPATAVTVPITNFRGAWVSTATYGVGAVATYSGASYISLVNGNTGILPSSVTVTLTADSSSGPY